eukprot:12797992-Prorocentrum_lima.AAC.1
MPPYQPRSNGLNGLIERLLGIVKEHMRKVAHAAGLGESCSPATAMYVTYVMRHNSTGRIHMQPAC